MKKSFLQFVRKTKNQPLHPIILWIYTQNEIERFLGLQKFFKFNKFSW